MTTYLSFQKRMRHLTQAVSSGRISYQKYIEGFDSVLQSVGWNEQDLVEQIDQHWD